MMKYLERILEFKLIELDGFSFSVYNLLLLVIIYFAVKGVTHSLDLLIKKRLAKKGVIDEGRSNSITQILKYLIYISGGFIATQSIGLDITVIGTFLVTLGIGIGFAFQDLLKDVISGVVILFEGNVAVGDILEVDGLVGTVKEVKLRTSLIRTRDGIFIVVPNSKIVNEKVINWSTNTKISRFNVSIGVAYGSDVERVKAILLQITNEHELICSRPTPMVIFSDLAEYSLLFEVYFWTLDSWQIEVIKSDLRFRMEVLFRENNIHIPFPQRDIHLINK